MTSSNGCTQCNSCSANSFDQSHWKNDHPDECECDGGGMCHNKHTTVVKCKYGEDDTYEFLNKLCDNCVADNCLADCYGFEIVEVVGDSHI
jgi:hypothetical protein